MRQSGAERITVPEARARGESPLHVKTSLLAPVVTDIHVGLTRGFADYLADRKTDEGQHWRRRPSRPHLRRLHGLFSRDVLTFKWRCRTVCLPARRFRHWGFGQGGASRVCLRGPRCCLQPQSPVALPTQVQQFISCLRHLAGRSPKPLRHPTRPCCGRRPRRSDGGSHS